MTSFSLKMLNQQLKKFRFLMNQIETSSWLRVIRLFTNMI